MVFTLLQWNISYLEDVAAIAEYIKLTGADIVCLQELTSGYHSDITNSGAHIAEVLGYYSFFEYGPALLPDGEQTLMGNGIFSRYPIKTSRQIALQEGLIQDGKVLRAERSYLQTIIKLPDFRLGVGTAHLLFHPRFQTTHYKMAMIDKITDSTLSTNEVDGFVFAGDLNATPRSKAAATLRRQLKNAGPALHHNTWTTQATKIGPWSYEELKWRLDYVLYRGRLKSRHSEILYPSLSDHLPILVEFSSS